ncbi:MAG TPA: hypothetical protein VGQ65_12355 [Thermoanaerobaculia bacterium]|jgi:hypothetical protein|nr:hypothetical protein [Thermoanaerobaculia bacterium]
MLLSTFNRGASLDELRLRKRDYDESVVEWMTNFRGNLLLTREMFGEVSYLRLQKTIGDRLLHDFNDIDECLTHAYDTRMEPSADEKAVVADLARCEVSTKLDSVNDTTYEISDDLFALASQRFNARASPSPRNVTTVGL